MRRLPNPTRALFARYPWSVVVLFLGLAAYIAVSLAREETRLPPRGSEAIVWRLVGLAAVAGLILLIRQLYDRGCLGLAAIVLAAGTVRSRVQKRPGVDAQRE